MKTRSRSFTAVDGVLFDKAMKTVHTYPRGKAGSHYTIPARVTAIGDSVFAECKSLRTLELSRKTQVADNAFEDGPQVQLTALGVKYPPTLGCGGACTAGRV